MNHAKSELKNLLLELDFKAQVLCVNNFAPLFEICRDVTQQNIIDSVTRRGRFRPTWPFSGFGWPAKFGGGWWPVWPVTTFM